jgi:hypothetical protein
MNTGGALDISNEVGMERGVSKRGARTTSGTPAIVQSYKGLVRKNRGIEG